VQRYNLALIGFGGVNRALAELIRDENARFEAELGIGLRVVAITDLAFGSLVQDDGIDLASVLSIPRDGTFAVLPGGDRDPRNEWVIRNSSADIVAEATFTNPTDGEPAVSHVRWAFESGKHVATTNKGPVALRGRELKALAADNGVRFEFEGSVMSGTPVLRLAEQLLDGLRVSEVEGILNGTSNYVIGRMEQGLTLDEAIAEAQDLGYAEADPTADIGGSDVRLKVVILANEVLGAQIGIDDVVTTGIEGITPEQIREAEREGRRWKLIGSAHAAGDGAVKATVAPVALPAEHPLAGISGPTNAVSFGTDLLGSVTVSGPGAGRVETAYALLSDIVAIHETATRNGETRD
jgi:homoserine dehydrogenase